MSIDPIRVTAENFHQAVTQKSGYVLVLIQEHEHGKCGSKNRPASASSNKTASVLRGSGCSGRGKCGLFRATVLKLTRQIAGKDPGVLKKLPSGVDERTALVTISIEAGEPTQQLAFKQLGARSLPTLMLYKDGKQMGDILTSHALQPCVGPKASEMAMNIMLNWLDGVSTGKPVKPLRTLPMNQSLSPSHTGREP